MGLLADFLSEEDKNQYIEESFQPGKVIVLWCDFITPPHNKYLICGCVDPQPLFLYINSSIRPFVQNNFDLLECQVTIYSSPDHEFLDHDSYIDCSKVINNFSKEEIVGQLSKDITRIKGNLSSETLKRIIQVIKTTRTLSPDIKRQLIKNFS